MAHVAPEVVETRFLRVLHRAFVQARNLALQGECQQLVELADTFEVLPELMAQWDEGTLERVRGILAEYQSAHPDCGYEYLSLLDGENAGLGENGFSGVTGHGG
jgi:hypothetical protein